MYKSRAIPYLPVYNARPCIMRTPILDCTLEKKKKGSRKQRKWLRKNCVKRFGNTLKTTTRSSLQKCHSMHQPRNEQFFRWTLLAVSLCKIMDTVRYPLHPAPRLLKEHYGLGTEFRGIRAKLEFSFANTTFTFSVT